VVDFFEEVEEDLRGQRLRKIIRYAPWAGGVVGAVFLGWLGYAGFNFYADKAVSQASISYADGLKALDTGDKAAADRAFAKAEKPLAPTYKALALMQQAGIAASQNRNPDAIKDLDAAAKAAGGNRVLADLANLQAAYRLMDTAPFSEVEARLKPLAEPGRPFQASATEALGMAQLKAGRYKDAKANFSALGNLLGATQDMRELADMGVRAIDSGEVQHVLDIAKTAATLPPAPPPAAGAPTTPSAGPPAPQDGAGAQ
jgi:hypothetical protein